MYVNVDVIPYLFLFHSDSLMVMMTIIMSLLLQLVMINAYNSCTSGVFSNGDFLWVWMIPTSISLVSTQMVQPALLSSAEDYCRIVLCDWD